MVDHSSTSPDLHQHLHCTSIGKKRHFPDAIALTPTLAPRASASAGNRNSIRRQFGEAELVRVAQGEMALPAHLPLARNEKLYYAGRIVDRLDCGKIKWQT
jgi:hypothetical protein